MKAIRILPLLAVLLLSACATVPPSAPVAESDYDARTAELLALTAWSLSGRAAIRTAEESGTVSLDWRQLGERYRVDLRAPWGAGTVRVDGGPGAVMLRTGDGIEDYADSPAELLAYYTGYELPLESLRYWLLGVPDPAAEATVTLHDRGLVSELRQHGWRVQYRRYGDYAGHALPSVVFLSGEGIEVRIAVQRWDLTL